MSVNIECFSCSGGMAEGFRRAGIEFSWVFDKDPDAVASYTRNLGHAPIQMDVRDLLRLVKGGWNAGAVDLFVADPPCTPWSRAGKRQGVADERDMLGETCELIRLLRPRAYLIGNVPGLQDNTQWQHIQDVLEPLRKTGYCVADYAQLDAADYGVPQRRVRPFWFGHLSGPCLRWPSKTHGPTTDQLQIGGLELKPWVTCRDALSHLSLAELGRPVRIKRHEDHNLTDPNDPAKVITRNTHGDGTLLRIAEGHPTAKLDGVAPTIRGGGEGHSAPQVILKQNNKHPVNQLDRPSYVVTTKGDGRGAQGAWPCRQRWPRLWRG